MADPEGRGLAALYNKVRGSKYCFIALIAYIVLSRVLHWLSGYDPGLDQYNANLSAESSISLGVGSLLWDRLVAWLKEWREQQRKTDERMLHMMEVQHAMAKAQEVLMRRLLGKKEARSCGSGSSVSSSSPPSSQSHFS